MVAGKAFEFSLLSAFDEKLRDKTNVQVVENGSFTVARGCFAQLDEPTRSQYRLYSSFAVNFLIDLEPRLSHDLGDDDVLELELMTDSRGKTGDVRDLLAIRALQKWEIGVSAKNNHHALKHSRLSSKIDFGNIWMERPCSPHYWHQVNPIFDLLTNVRRESNGTATWKDLGNHHETVYLPILQAFRSELLSVYKMEPDSVVQKLISYLVGTSDYYKIIKLKRQLVVKAFNLYGTLNLPFQDVTPTLRTPVVPFPTRIVSFDIKRNTMTTLVMKLDEDWEISFRIHSAKSTVEPSLKFDIKLVSFPECLFINRLSLKGVNA